MGHSERDDPKLTEVKAVLQRLQRFSAEPEGAGLRPATAAPGPARRIAIVPAIIIGVVAVILAATYPFLDLKRMAVSTPSRVLAPATTPQKAAAEDTPTIAPGGPPTPPAPAPHKAATEEAPTVVPDGPAVPQPASTPQREAAEDAPTIAPGGPPPPPASAPHKAATEETPTVVPDGPAVPQPAASTPQKAAADDAPAVLPRGPSVPQIDRGKTPPATPALDVALGLMTNGRVRAARQQLLGLAAEGSPDVAWALARSYDPNFLATMPAADAGPDIEEATRWYRTWYAAAVKEGLVADSVSLERIIRSMR